MGGCPENVQPQINRPPQRTSQRQVRADSGNGVARTGTTHDDVLDGARGVRLPASKSLGERGVCAPVLKYYWPATDYADALAVR